MKIVVFIFGLIAAVSGLGLMAYGWYLAYSMSRIYEGLTYSGPFLLIVGCWRTLVAGMATSPPAMLRIFAVGLGLAAGYGNTASLKVLFPADQIVSSNSNH